MPVSVDSQRFIELIFSFENSTSKDECESNLNQFIQELGFNTHFRYTENCIYLSIENTKAAMTLIWYPRETHYCPRIAGKAEDDFTGISMDELVCIWRVFNAYAHAIWQLPPLYKLILEELSKGQSLQDIAKKSELSLASIKRYMGLIRKLLGARTNPHAVAIALRQGWI